MDAITVTGLVGAVVLAFANGANDISKSIATLVGSGESDFKKSVIVVSLASAAGSVMASAWAVKMTLLFTKGMISPQAHVHQTFALAIIAGAIGWVLFSTRFGLPVSTTHAILGSTVLTTIYAFGFDMVLWGNVTKKVALPLLISPLAAFALSFLVLKILGAFTPKQGANYKWAHWASSITSGFARGLNDTPKIASLGLVFYFLLDPNTTVAPRWFFMLLAAGNAAGGILMGMRVTETLAHKVTKLNHREGLAANLATTAMVVATAIHGLPVSTTHVSGSAIMGMGMSRGAKSLNPKVVGEIVLAWLVTVPTAGAIGMAAYWLIEKIH